MANVTNGYFLDHVSETGPSQEAWVKDAKYVLIYFTCEGVSQGGGAVIGVESQAPDMTWHPISIQTINSPRLVPPLSLEGAYAKLRVNVYTYTDGIFTVTFNTKSVF